MPFVTLLFGLIALSLIITGVPLALGKVRPNQVYGLRTSDTLSDTDLWYAANRRFGRNLIIAGVLLLGWALANLGGPVVGGETETILVSTAVLAFTTMIAAVAAMQFAIHYKSRK